VWNQYPSTYTRSETFNPAVSLEGNPVTIIAVETFATVTTVLEIASIQSARRAGEL
jgi:hypothetical protein